MFDDPYILYPIDEVLVVSAITANSNILKSGKVNAVPAYQRPNFRDIVFQAIPFSAEPFVKEFSLSVISVASWQKDNLVLKEFCPTIKNCANP